MSSIYRQNHNGFSPKNPGLLPTPSSPLLKALTWIIILNRHVFQSRVKLLWLSKVARVLLTFHLGILMYLLRVKNQI